MPFWVQCVLTALFLYVLGVALILLGLPWVLGATLFVVACFFVLVPLLPERRR